MASFFERICDIKKYSERDARDVSHILLSTMGYLHDMDIVHRDIKPENLLLVSSTDNTTVKVADFGFAVRLKGSKTTTACGTPATSPRRSCAARRTAWRRTSSASAS